MGYVDDAVRGVIRIYAIYNTYLIVSKVYAMLKHGGAFARFANHPYRGKDNPILSAEIDKLYSKYYCAFHGKDMKAEAEYSEEQAMHRAQVAEKYGFVDIAYGMFYRTRTFSAKEYVEL